MNTAAILLIALLKTSGEGGTITLPYDTLEACQAAGERLEVQFEALVLEDADQQPTDAHARAVWTCFDPAPAN